MLSDLKALLKRAIYKWVNIVTTFPGITLILSFVLTVVLGFHAGRHLGVITDTGVMLSERLDYIKVHRHFKREFPHSYDQVVILIEGITPDIAVDARDRLASALRAKRRLFRWVYLPGDDKFFRENGLLFLDTKDLERLSDNLAKAQPILSRLVEETNLTGLFSTLTLALNEKKKGTEIPIENVLRELNHSFSELNHGRFYEMSWMSLMSEGVGSLPKRQIIICQPSISYETILPGKSAISTIRDMARKLNLTPQRGVRILLTGDIPMQYDELKSVTRGAKMAGILSMVMVSVVLLTGLGSFRLVLATLSPLVAGLVWTAWFASITIGHLNMISVAFAVLFIGLGVDYAIHLSLRYRELIKQGNQSQNALLMACQDVGPSLVLCALTTSVGFYSFMPTDFSGVAELGLISGTGMFIALFANLTLLPAVVTLFPLSASHKRIYYVTSESHHLLLRIVGIPYKHGRFIRIFTVISTFLCLFLLPRVHFDSNPIHLRDPDAESIIAFKKLLEEPHGSPWSIEDLVGNRQEAVKKKAAFEALDQVRHVLWIGSFIPRDQDEKLGIIDDMEMLLGPILYEDVKIKRDEWKKEFESLLRFKEALIDSMDLFNKREEKRLVYSLVRNINYFTGPLKEKDNDLVKLEISRLREMLLASFPSRIRYLRDSLKAEGITEDALPKSLRSQWIGKEGSFRLQVVPKKNPENDRELMSLVDAARSVDKNVTGYPVLVIEGGRAVVRAFKQAFCYSLLAILFFLLILMPRWTDAVIILYSLFLAGLLSAAFMVFFNIPLNFANIIALPLIMGIGVDNGIHIVHRHRRAIERPSSLLQTSTARGIFFSTLTTICSFGNLAVSPHVGMASMGKLLTIGITMALLTSMFMIPAFLLVKRKKPDSSCLK